MKGGNRQPCQCDEKKQHEAGLDKADGADADRAERDDWQKDTAEIMLIHQVAEYRLKQVAGDRQNHDEQAAQCQRQAEPRHDKRQKNRQEITIEIVEKMTEAKKNGSMAHHDFPPIAFSSRLTGSSFRIRQQTRNSGTRYDALNVSA